MRQLALNAIALRHARALALSLDLETRSLPLGLSFVFLVLHLFGIAAIARLSHQPLWLASFPLFLIQPLALSIKLRRINLLPESFAPMSIAYAMLFLRLGIALARGTVPEPWGNLFDLNVATAFCASWVLLAQIKPLAQAFAKPIEVKNCIGFVVAGVTMAWATWTYLGIRTHGVTASDPYAYAQMAVDLAERGSALHQFRIAPHVADWGLPLLPTFPVGYRLLDARTGAAASVWSPGWSALMAVGYSFAGETALYLAAPVMGLLSLVALWLTVNEFLRAWQIEKRLLASGIAVFVLATSYQQVERLAVPMSDIPAQLFTTLTIYFAARGARERTLKFFLLSGLCLGAAFDMRYAQVLIGVSLLPPFLISLRANPHGEFFRAIIVFIISAFVAASPIFWYHTTEFGGPLNVGSWEMQNFDAANIRGNAIRLVADLMRTNEFLLLSPLVGWGIVRLWRISKQFGAVAVIGVLGLVVFHLPYASYSLRQLLPVFPALALWAGVGMAELIFLFRRFHDRIWQTRIQVAGIVLALALLWTRTSATLRLAFAPTSFNTFGYLRAEQRVSFDALARMIPPNGIIVASLNGGAVELYARRDAVRAAVWSEDEWLDFVNRALDDGRAVFVLADGGEMERPLRATQARYSVNPIAQLPMPYFNQVGGSMNTDVALFAVMKSSQRGDAK